MPDRIGFYGRLQVRRFNRFVRSAGVHPALGWLILLTTFVVLVSLLAIRGTLGAQVLGLLGVMLVWPLSERGRVDFLQTHYRQDHNIIRIAENLALSTPFVVGLCTIGRWTVALAVLGFTLILAFVRTPLPRFSGVHTPFSNYPYEFPSGLRRWWALLVLQLAVFILGIVVNNHNISVFAIGTVYLTILGFYSKPEPLFYVWIHTSTAKEFILSKARAAFIQSLMLLIIPSIIICVLSPGLLWYVSGCLILGGFLTVMALLAKYAYYPSEVNVIGGFLIAASIVIPPLMLFTIPFLYKRAIRTITPLVT